MVQSFQSSHFFVIKPSRRLRWAVDFLHLLAFVASGLNALPVFYRVFLCGVVMIIWALSRGSSNASTPQLRYTKNKGWEIAFDSIDYVGIEVSASTVITPWVVFLCFKTDTHMSLTIANDALSADDFRRLRVQLMLSGCGRK